MIEYVVAYGFTVNTDKRFLPLIHKMRPEFLKGVLNLPGGKLKEDETPVEAAVRELREETGLEEVQEFDPMVYYPCEYMGLIRGNDSIIHCVKVPVCFTDKLTPQDSETEVAGWFSIPEVYDHPKLMPNLRLVVPLMESGSRNWEISDLTLQNSAEDGTKGTWRYNRHHTVDLSFKNMVKNPLVVTVRGMAYYDE